MTFLKFHKKEKFSTSLTTAIKYFKICGRKYLVLLNQYFKLLSIRFIFKYFLNSEIETIFRLYFLFGFTEF